MSDYHKYMKIKDTVHDSQKSKKLDNLLSYCQNNQALFVDKEFPPDQTSLKGNPQAKDYNGQFDQIQWKRAAELFGEGNYDIFKGISPHDIRQGSLGNCYFLCSLASLAEYPDLIKRLFDFDHVNEYGINSVWLNINGIWRQIILDEYFPSHNKGRGWDLAFSKTDQQELWVILLEKAYAKAYGSYWEIIGGDPVHALRDLTGAPYDRIDNFDDLDAAWAKLKDANTKQYMLTCFTKSSEVTEEQGNEGLVSGHAYTILDARNIIDSRGNPQRIVQIRNPWGKFEWNGAFSDNSELWTPELKQKLDVKVEDDGIFWIRLEDFVRYFQGIGILEIIPGAIANGLQVKQSNNNKTMIRMSVEEQSNMMFSIDQCDSRIVDNPEYQYSYFRVTIGKLLGNKGIEFMDSILSPERNIFLENQLDKGDYIVLIEAYWTNKLVNNFNVGTYSEEQIGMELIPSNEQSYNHCEYLIWKDFGRKRYKEMKSKGSRVASDGHNQAEVHTFQCQNKKYANVLYNYINQDSNNSVHQTIKFNKLKGFNPVGMQCSNEGADLIINAQDNDVLLFKMDPRSKGFSLSNQITQEEVMPHKFTPDVSTFEVLNSLGGTQPTPDNPNPDVVSRLQKIKDQEKNRLEQQKLDKLRAQQREARKRRMEEIRQRELREKQEQSKILQQKGMGNDMISKLFGMVNGTGGGGWGFGQLDKILGLNKPKRSQQQQQQRQQQQRQQQIQRQQQQQRQQQMQRQQQQYGQQQQRQQYGQQQQGYGQQRQQQGYSQQRQQQQRQQQGGLGGFMQQMMNPNQQRQQQQNQGQKKQDCTIF